LAFIYITPLLNAVSELAIDPASLLIDFVRFCPPADSQEVKMRRPVPSVLFLAVMTATTRTVQMYLPPRMEYENSTIAAAVAFKHLSGFLKGSVVSFLCV
jgi:hypothetical protein